MSLGEERARPRGWPDTYGEDAQPRMGFFTDTSLCIGCKACEVACKEWNQLPTDDFGFKGHSYDNTDRLSANTWRHVAFIEQRRERVGLDDDDEGGLRWLMSSDVCKHCTTAACLDVCPTGALFRTEFGTVVVQDDVCNGCGMCVPACPFGVIERREDDGRAWKCTLCYDRLKDGLEPACAKACPTDSIMFGPVEDLREVAVGRLEDVKRAGEPDAQLYLHGADDGVDGAGAFFLLLDEPEVYGLPPDPIAPTKDLRGIWGAVAGAAATIALGVAAATVGTTRRGRR
jgi:formate dehydrogenase iron-sulfur subunit